MPYVGAKPAVPAPANSSRVTTGSDRRRPVYLNRVRDLVRSHIHQLRVADIIYFDLRPSSGIWRSQARSAA
jgi:hypothetical protein